MTAQLIKSQYRLVCLRTLCLVCS